MPLPTRDARVINGLSRRAVEQTLAGLKPTLSGARWATATNRYSTDTVAKLEAEIAAGQVPHRRDVAQYIAASALLHSADGWSYLGRAITALLRGDPHRARHLAYYAELRAATSVLAAEGIGVFNKHHFALTAPNVAAKLHSTAGTHRFSWQCLEHWAGRSSSGSLFARMIRPYGIPLEDWFATIGGVAAIGPQIQAWFRQWGVDLQSFPDDRDARNISSYQPDGLPQAWYIEGRDTLEFVRDLWDSLEPSPQSQFETIDRHILRLGVWSLYTGRSGRSPAVDTANFHRFAEGVVKSQSLSSEAERQWLRFMTRSLVPHDAIVFSRSKLQANDVAAGAHAVISRAALLLRVASGSTTMLLRGATFSSNTVSFWSKGLGEARGLWEGDAVDPSDLWADVSPMLRDVELFQQKYTSDQQSFYRMGAELGQAILGLGSFERVAIWSMTP
ncbi:hypothetical protein ACQR16_26700 [Bradyrhizobium oligotrophicum]|uniref:hypothetical protein n=1 Tax=Bradyrhizobium oligotrophicum TaxID=44255 RepID=UPI003EBE845B